MENMIEHTVTVKTIIVTIGKPLLALAVVLGFDHVFDFMILQVDSHIFLSEFAKQLLNELKLILSVILSFLVCIKLLLGIKKLTKEKK